MAGVLIKWGNLDTDVSTGRCHIKMEAEMGWCIYRPEKIKDANKPPELEGDLGQIPPHGHRRNEPCRHLDLRLLHRQERKSQRQMAMSLLRVAEISERLRWREVQACPGEGTGCVQARDCCSGTTWCHLKSPHSPAQAWYLLQGERAHMAGAAAAGRCLRAPCSGQQRPLTFSAPSPSCPPSICSYVVP